MTVDLFESVPDVRPAQEAMAEGAVLLRGFAIAVEADLIAALRVIVGLAPFRHMMTPGGFVMSVLLHIGFLAWATIKLWPAWWI